MPTKQTNERTPLFDKAEESLSEETVPILAASNTNNVIHSDTATRWLSRCFKEEHMGTVKSVIGYCLVIVAGLVFTAANVIQKIIAPEIIFWHLLLYRAIVQMILMGVSMIVCRVPSFRGPVENRTRIFYQGILGGILLLCIFVAIKHVPLGNASAIFFCTPVCTFVFAIFMLNENMGAYRSFISVVMVTGVILITRPPILFGTDPIPKNMTDPTGNATMTIQDITYIPTDPYLTIGYLCAIMVPVLSAVVSILTRQLKHIHAPVLMFWFAVGSFIVACGGIVFSRSGGLFQLSFTEWFCTFAIIVFGLIGNISYTFAVRWVSPSKANVFRSFEVILNYALQLSLEHTMFHVSNIFGILFLLLAVFSTGFESEVMAKYGQKYNFL